MMLLLGSMRAEEPSRLPAEPHPAPAGARLLASSLILRMTREEIGSYLGLSSRPWSRTFSKFQERRPARGEAAAHPHLDEAACAS